MDWDLDDDEQQEEEQPNRGGSKNQEQQPEPLSEEDQRALAYIRKLGITPEEAAARVSRDLQNERGQGATARNGQERGENEDEGEVVTRGQMKRMLDEARKETLVTSTRSQLGEKIDERSEAAFTEAFGKDLSPKRLDQYQRQVREELSQIPGILTMPRAKFREHLDKTIAGLVKEEQAWRGTGSGEQLEERLQTAKATGGGSQGGAGSGDRGPRPRSADEGFDPEDQEFGVGVDWPTQLEVDKARRQDLRKFNRQTGRGKR